MQGATRAMLLADPIIVVLIVPPSFSFVEFFPRDVVGVGVRSVLDKARADGQVMDHIVGRVTSHTCLAYSWNMYSFTRATCADLSGLMGPDAVISTGVFTL